MSNQKCETCKFFKSAGGTTGECRRYPPQCVADEDCAWERFPVLVADEWCGEYKEKELDINE